MSLSFATTLRSVRATAIRDALDAAATPGKFLLYDGTQPATGAAITTETLIGTCVLSKPCGTVTDGVLSFAAIADDPVADATGTIGWARAVDGDDVFVMDMSCGVTGGTEVLLFNTLSAQAGGVIQILGGSIAEGNA